MSDISVRSIVRLLRVAFPVLLTLVSCQKAELSVSVSEISLDNTLIPVTIEISSNSDWSVNIEDSWLTADPSKGSGDAAISLTPTINIFGQERQTLINVSSRGVTVPVTVTQSTASISFSPDSLRIPKEGGTFSLNVASNASWMAVSTSSLISFTPSSGVGNQEIDITASSSTSRKIQTANIVFKSGGYSNLAYVILEPIDNQGPEKPQLIQPADSSTGISVLPTFRWSCSDPDGDVLKYSLYYASDTLSWNIVDVDRATSYTLDSRLDEGIRYYWKVVADDGNARENSKSQSKVNTFIVGDKIAWEDGEHWLYMTGSVNRPVNLYVTGDGFIDEDYEKGGVFDSYLREGIDKLFSIEPYRSYKEYFNVYAIAAYSEERGMTINGKQTRNTKFSVTKEDEGASTAISCDSDAVFGWIKTIPNVDDLELTKSSILLISNEDIYAGTCFMYQGGESIGIVPVSTLTSEGLYTDYCSILMHEFGGHGIGRFADEYVNYEGQKIPDTGEWSVETVNAFQSYGAFMNISVSESEMPWSDLVGLSGYERITNPEGGCYYAFGVWRSERTSCMIDNMNYYSAAQRLAIVRRIMSVSEEEFSLEQFLEKDIQKEPSEAKGVKSSFTPYKFTPLAPPVLKSKR